MSEQKIQKRGVVTERIKAESKKLLGYEVTTTELRLMAYTQYVMCNDQRIDPNKCNQDDREVLKKWHEHNYIEGGASGLSITREFWDAMCSLIFLGYVDLEVEL